MSEHIQLPDVSFFIDGETAMVTKKETYGGPTKVVEELRQSGQIAFWGERRNDFPQRVIDDLRTTSLIPAVIERKVDMLVGGGIQYGTVKYDERTGLETMHPMRVAEIDDWLEDTNAQLYTEEAARDWYTYYNIFPEITMGRAYDRILGLGCQDAAQVRLGVMDDKGRITKAYLNDWRNSHGLGDAIPRHALDPRYRVHQQVLNQRKAHYILPIRILDRDQFYYGLAPWNGLRVNGWLQVAKRVPELKLQLIKNLWHIPLLFEVDEAYWPRKFKDWNKKSEVEQIDLMRTEHNALSNWAKGSQGQGGTFMSTMLSNVVGKDQVHLVKLTAIPFKTPEGAYIEDSQEAEFIICRDLGLKPSLHGISPSKSGSSPGSGSEDRMARTHHVLDQKRHADRILSPLRLTSRVNGWDEKYGKDQRLTWWFKNYYAATLDRTMQVGDLNAPQVPDATPAD